MSYLKGTPSRTVLRKLRTTSTAQGYVRIAPLIQHRYESTTKPPEEERKSFKGQLYDSTAARTARDRQESERFARERGESAGARNAALTFGMWHISA
jgi:D-lactate dehydrogenase (cytochrome)